MKVKAIVQRGLDKNDCDDAILINDIFINDGMFTGSSEELKFVCIADGVGGNAGGKQASHFILETIKSSNFSNYSLADFRDYFIKLNIKLIDYARDCIGKSEMASTFTGLFFVENSCFLAHVGNTRLYQQQGEYIKQLTIDQTQYQWFINMGYFEKAETCNKNEIVGCFGGGCENYLNTLVVKEIFQNRIPNVILLTTDGIHDYIEIDDFEYAIKEDLNFDYIMGKARKNGSTDDASIVAIFR